MKHAPVSCGEDYHRETERKINENWLYFQEITLIIILLVMSYVIHQQIHKHPHTNVRWLFCLTTCTVSPK